MAEEEAAYSQQQLVQSLRQRSEAAFHYLYDHYAAALYTTILDIVADRPLASDVLQEAFIKIWKQIGSYDDTRGRLFTWMLKIARNTAIDTTRGKDYRAGRQIHALDESVYEAGAAPEQKAEAYGLRKLVQQLREEQRVVVELSYFEGYTHEEISKLLGLPVGTVKTRIRSGLYQLKQIMQNGGY